MGLNAACCTCTGGGTRGGGYCSCGVSRRCEVEVLRGGARADDAAVWEQWWAWITEPDGVSLPVVVSVLVVLAGSGVAVWSRTWRWSRVVATWVHECGHAVVGVVVGRSLAGIRVQGDASGVTTTVGPARGAGRVATTFAGYPAPALTGAVMVSAVAAGHTRWVLVGVVAVVVLVAPFQRSWRGLLVTVLVVAAVWGLAQSPAEARDVSAVVVLGCAGFLLAASPRTLMELRRVRVGLRAGGASAGSGGGGVGHSDADSLAHQTGIPAAVWEIVFVVVVGASWWWVGVVLLRA